ncbi:LysR family transcriptional regulator [Fulvivirga sp. 29W222]|uniref:LysR family transcriptional regulator n=2 Tax=Fulvivirga marina TaxID=2494733 RepID=A0A937KAZ0_9BACT|nr:LysR family transcriptional regulator [Fulvivirga marina]MBL6445144.1 LysR family transcriptional regulator [Fulvivirga marina]
MELRHFRLIKTIAEEGNIANSSEKLFLTQSALSHQLRELEEQLGFKVFHRSRNKWELTEEGAELHKLANTIHSAIEQGFHSIKNINEGTKGLVRISTECYSFYQGLPTFIQKMAALYPKIDVELILDATHHPVSKILSNDIDIAIVTSKPSTPILSCKALFEDEILAIMHKEHPLADKPTLEAGDFSEAHLIIHSFPLETVSVYQTFLMPNNIIPVRISAIPLTEVALEMVSANMGITCMPQWALKSFKVPEELILKRISKNGLKRTHYLISRTEDHSKKYIAEFISSFEENFLE